MSTPEPEYLTLADLEFRKLREDIERNGGKLGPLELRRKIKVRTAAMLNDLSEQAFRRHYGHLIRKITPNRDVVELGDALALPSPDTS
jgi:hypothetical protein